MRFTGITQNVQSKYQLEKIFTTSSCEYEEWDTPEKLCHLLFCHTPLIGEVKLSQEQYHDFSQRGEKLFSRLMTAGKESLSQLEKQILSAAVVFHVQELDDSSVDDENADNRLWSNVLEKLGFDEEIFKCKQQSAYNKLRDLVWENLHISTQYGNKYYNTIKIQALAPSESICSLYNIIYRFYRTNLECQYEEAANAFAILVKNVQEKLNKARTSSDIDLGSSLWALKSSVKILFQNQPKYMEAICDAITMKMDAYLRGDDPAFCECNRWDVLLKQWFDKKSSEEKATMHQVRAKRIRQKIATKIEDIHPEYILANDTLIIRLPSIRLPEITQRPVLQLIQGTQVIYSSKMSVYGDSMCYTTREFLLDLCRVENTDFNNKFNFQVKITCGNNVIYESESNLFREYIIFNESGHESTLTKCKNNTIYLVASNNVAISIGATEEDYYDESDRFQQLQVFLPSTKQILVNGIDILAIDEKDIPLRCYCVPDAVCGIRAISCGQAYQIYDKPPILHILLRKNISPKDYQIYLENRLHSLYEYHVEDNMINIELPRAAKFFHSVRIKEFNTGKTIYQCNYIILPQFCVSFSEPYYLNKHCEGNIIIKFSGGTHKYPFGLTENQSVVTAPLFSYDSYVEADIPKIDITINGENILYWPPVKWHEDIHQDDFIKVTAPQNISLDFILGGKLVSKTKRGRYYELGNCICANTWANVAYTLGMLIRDTKCHVREEKITDIYFSPQFVNSPIEREGTQLKWRPAASFIGPSDSTFFVELDNDEQSDPWGYRCLRPGKTFEKNFSCGAGSYECRVYTDVINDTPFSQQELRQLVWRETFNIEANPTERFQGKCIRLTKAQFWYYDSQHVEWAAIHYNDALISDIKYMGFGDLDGNIDKKTSLYEGILMFRKPDGFWCRMNNTANNELYERINPVAFYITSDNFLVVYNAEGELLELDARLYYKNHRVRIKNRKPNYTKDEAIRWLPIADKFTFREEDEM